MNPAVETSGVDCEDANEILTPTDLTQTIGVLQGLLDTMRAINVKRFQGRIKELHARLEAMRTSSMIPQPFYGTTVTL